MGFNSEFKGLKSLSTAGTAGLNSAEGTDIRLWCLLCVVNVVVFAKS